MVGGNLDHKGAISARQHHPYNADIDHSGAFTKNTGQRAQHQGNCRPQGKVQRAHSQQDTQPLDHLQAGGVDQDGQDRKKHDCAHRDNGGQLEKRVSIFHEYITS